MSRRTEVVTEILVERRRQVEKEGWSESHDDAHGEGQLAEAAAAYASRRNLDWPWAPGWDKRRKHSRRRRLVIAAALLVAEIERLDRAAEAAGKEK